MNEELNGGTQTLPGSVAGATVPQPPLLEEPTVHPLEFSFRQMDTDRQQIQSQMKNLQEQQKELVDGQKTMLTFFEKFPEIRRSEMARGNKDILNRVQIPESSQPALIRLGKQALLDNQTEGVYPECVAAKTSRPAASRDAVSSASVTGTSRHPRTSPKRQHQVLLEGQLERNREISPDQLVREPSRLPVPLRHRGVNENYPVGPNRIEVPAPVGHLPRMELVEETLLDRMEERLRLRRGGHDEVHQPLGEEPLTARIRASRLPVGWVTPSFSRFDGKSDPDQHLMEYRTLMAPNDSDDQLARMFKQSLKGPALLWYVRLRRNSINSFEALAREFSRQYACSRAQPKRIDALFDLKMGPKETLKDFVTRFREEASEVAGADRNEGMICAAFKNALLEGHPMKVDLILKPKVRLSDLYERAQKRIRVEVDALRGRRTVAVHVVAEAPNKTSAKEERAIPQESRRTNPPPLDRSRGKAAAFPQPRYPRNPTREYTRFIISPEQMLEKIRREPQYRPAIPYYISPDRIDHSKFCRYHNYDGHWTNNCFQLLDLLEEMVAAGRLKSFIKSRMPASHPNRLKEVAEEAAMGEDILVIHGYSAIDDITQNRLKRRFGTMKKNEKEAHFSPQVVATSEEGIGFFNSDMQGLTFPHGNALIIKLPFRPSPELPLQMVHRILVDTGSSVDILFMHCFSHLKIPSTRLRVSGTTLSGFSGEKAKVEGEIDIEVIHRFGVPKKLIADNASYFNSRRIQDYIKSMGIKISYSSPYYPQANGQAEATNKTLINYLKKKLTDKKGLWEDELGMVTWGYRTTPRTSTGQSPFSLVYGHEAVITTESDIPSARSLLTTNQNADLLTAELNMIEERRTKAIIRLGVYQQGIRRSYSRRVRRRAFHSGDLVWRKIPPGQKNPSYGKFEANWGGPYIIKKVIANGAYELVDGDGNQMVRSCNLSHLKKYHQ